jgi:hypothetical protein
MRVRISHQAVDFLMTFRLAKTTATGQPACCSGKRPVISIRLEGLGFRRFDASFGTPEILIQPSSYHNVHP